MKKAIVLAIAGIAAGMATSSYGQSVVLLDNYNTYGPLVTYGAGSDGTVGVGVGNTYTMGIYWALGTVSASADPSGTAIPSTLGPVTLGAGLGSTAQFASLATAGTAGEALGGATFGIPGTSGAGGENVTLMIIAYEGASYAAATERGHSTAFQITTSANNSTTPVSIGTAMPGFSVFSTTPTPEPTTMALGGLGLAALLVARRKKA